MDTVSVSEVWYSSTSSTMNKKHINLKQCKESTIFRLQGWLFNRPSVYAIIVHYLKIHFPERSTAHFVFEVVRTQCFVMRTIERQCIECPKWKVINEHLRL